MPSSYTSSLRLTLPATGELNGTWGTTVNTGITQLVDTAVAGYVSIAMSDADYTLSAANGATDEARNMFVDMTGTLTAARNVICPTAEKLYFFKNSTTGGYALTLKTSGGTGISVPNGKSMVLMCDGTNVIDATSHMSSLTLASALPVASGGTGTSVSTGSGSLVLAASPTLVTPTLGAAAATSINFGQDALSYYDEGTWTPTVTFATPGDLAVQYITQTGRYTRVGRQVFVQCLIITGDFVGSNGIVFTTASGEMRVAGLPFAAANTANLVALAPAFLASGVTGVSNFVANVSAQQNQTYVSVGYFSTAASSGSGGSFSASNIISGTSPQIQFCLTYTV